mmetsp:Transcript_63781/g.125219  ORF Transcript_63781/g.125219 Transcript_63781/m.125219 type:complete len:288 (-) Transcript_63781:407-1270(-)
MTISTAVAVGAPIALLLVALLHRGLGVEGDAPPPPAIFAVAVDHAFEGDAQARLLERLPRHRRTQALPSIELTARDPKPCRRKLLDHQELPVRRPPAHHNREEPRVSFSLHLASAAGPVDVAQVHWERAGIDTAPVPAAAAAAAAVLTAAAAVVAAAVVLDAAPQPVVVVAVVGRVPLAAASPRFSLSALPEAAALSPSPTRRPAHGAVQVRCAARVDVVKWHVLPQLVFREPAHPADGALERALSRSRGHEPSRRSQSSLEVVSDHVHGAAVVSKTRLAERGVFGG